MSTMVESSVKRIGGSFFVRIPPDEAKRLGITEDGQPVDVSIRLVGRGARDVLELKGRFRGALARESRRDLWGE